MFTHLSQLGFPVEFRDMNELSAAARYRAEAAGYAAPYWPPEDWSYPA